MVIANSGHGLNGVKQGLSFHSEKETSGLGCADFYLDALGEIFTRHQ
jgi:hypothetical protein